MSCQHKRTGGSSEGVCKCLECGMVAQFYLGGPKWHPPGKPPSNEEQLSANVP